VEPAVLKEIAARKYDGFLSSLREMVNIDCGSFTPDGVDRIADLCHERFKTGGWEVERVKFERAPDEPRLGEMVTGRLHGSGGKNVLMIGHTDTVFDEGTVAERPFTIDGHIAKGPGVSDMKGGLLTGFYAVEVLQEAGFDSFGTITYVCNPDEEIGSPCSGPVIRRLAPDNDAALVLEGARENGDIVSSRKGITDYRISFLGRAAHAGVEPERGRNAILQAAHATIALQELNGRWPGVTVNVGVARGGTRTNVVPERCDLNVDLRSPTLDTLEEAEREIERICRETVVPDVTVRIEGHGWHKPMEKKEGGERLVRIATEVAGELGFELHDASTGGASDANSTSAAGTPTLDGLGPVGGDDHAPGEWIDLASVVPRIALLAGVVSRL
jgi:glutamate carboxypeptidase